MKKIISSLFIIVSIFSFFLIFKTQKVEATSAISSVTLPAGYEVQDPATKLWTWIIDVNTVDLTGIQITDTFNGVAAKKTIPSSGINEYEYQNLQDGTSYTISWAISVLYSGSSYANLTATYTCKTGNTANCKAVINNQYPQASNNTQVNNVAPIVIPKDENLYKMLAPIGDITCMDSTGQDPNCIPNDIGKYLNMLFKLGIGVCAFLAVLMLIINGITYMGDESVFGKTEAKSKMFGAILGLLIALGAWALLNTINPNLNGTGGISISAATAETLVPTSGGGYYGVSVGAAGDPNANKNITTYDTFLQAAAQKYGLSCTLIKSFMYAESGGVNGLTSPSGAQGLIQLMPATFAQQNVGTNPMDPQTNIMAAASYLSKLQSTGCNGVATSTVCNASNTQYLAAAYNGGPRANKQATAPACTNGTNWQCTAYSGYQETRTYAPRVEANFNKLTANGWGC